MGISIGNFMGGINYNNIINQIMAINAQPLNAYQAQLSALNTKQQSISQIQSDVSALEIAAQKLTLTSNVGAKSATASSSALTATATSTAANGTYSVMIKQLATATTVSGSTSSGTATPTGTAVSQTAPLVSAGFQTPVTTGTFSINGVSFTINSTTVLNDPTNAANSLVNMINSSTAGVTASVVNDAYGRPNLIKLVSASGKSIQLGSSADTSNFLTAAGLSGAAIVGNTATSVTGSSVAAGAISATMTINGTAVTINQTNTSYTGAQNAAFIASAINAAKVGVTASTTGASNDQLQLTQNTLGSQGTISVSSSGTNAAALGVANGVYQNGTDAATGSSFLGAINPSASLSANTFSTALAPVSGGGSFTINGVSINWTTGNSLNDVLNQINLSSAGVRATYDALSDRVTLSATKTGGGSISLKDVSGNLLQSLHLLTNATTSVPQQLGQNAVVNIPGVNGGSDITSASNTLTNTIPGLTLNLQQTTPSPVTVTVGADVTTTTTNVQNFVNALNTLFTDINTATVNTPPPGQSGPLAGDSQIEGLQTALQRMVNGVVAGAASGYQNLASIGISTGAVGQKVASSYSFQLNTTTLSQALQNNPQAVVQLFVGTQANPGVAVQMNNYLNGLLGPTGLFTQRSKQYTTSQQAVNTDITNLQTLLTQQQQDLQQQFARLQATLGTLRGQSAQVAAQVAQLGGAPSPTFP